MPRSILDIGTGTGIWAKQVAREFPYADVIGTDLSLIQPTETMPGNCSFVREDSEEEWVFDKYFDFIHWRLMLSCCEFELHPSPEVVYTRLVFRMYSRTISALGGLE